MKADERKGLTPIALRKRAAAFARETVDKQARRRRRRRRPSLLGGQAGEERGGGGGTPKAQPRGWAGLRRAARRQRGSA